MALTDFTIGSIVKFAGPIKISRKWVDTGKVIDINKFNVVIEVEISEDTSYLARRYSNEILKVIDRLS